LFSSEVFSNIFNEHIWYKYSPADRMHKPSLPAVQDGGELLNNRCKHWQETHHSRCLSQLQQIQRL